MKLSKFGWLAALLAVAAVFGAVAYSPRSAEAAPTAANKANCGASAFAPTAVQCTLTFTDAAVPAGNTTYTVTINGPATFQSITAGAVTGPCTVTSATTTAGSQTASIVVNAAAAANCSFTFTEVLNITGAGGAVTQTVSGNGGASTTNPVNLQAAATTVMTAGNCVDEDDNPIVGTLELGIGETADVACVVDLDDNDSTPDSVSSGIVSVTIGSTSATAPVVVAVADQNDVSGTVSGNTGTVRCGTQQTDDTCDFVVVVFRVTGAAGPNGALPGEQNITITGSYTPDNQFLNTPANLAATQLFRVRTSASSAGFVNGDRFIIRCPASLNPLLATVPQLTPGQIGGVNNAIAVGILPAALICEAVFVTTNAAGETVVQNVAPGTIEISALSGSLVDLSGRLTTNLRIGCGTGTTVSDDLTTVNPNTCQGVRFGVLGIGVGFVEVRARYEPTSAAAAAGIREREAVATVGFIAPAVSLNLLLSPNPIAVGATNGVATLRFNRQFFFGDTLLIDPTTGLPIAINFGSPLNGTAEFRIANTAIAAFVDVLTTTTGTAAGGATTVATSGTTATAGQAFVRCGGQTAVVTGGNLSQFFGGCDQVTVGYRGVAAGSTQVSATFVPDLPNAFGLTPGGTALPATNLSGLLNLTGAIATNTVARNLEVVGAGPATTQRLVTGCNNVVAPANETVAQVAARVDPASAAVSVWRQVPGTTQFQGAPVSGTVPSGVANLSNVNALDAIFICVSAAATYRLT